MADPAAIDKELGQAGADLGWALRPAAGCVELVDEARRHGSRPTPTADDRRRSSAAVEPDDDVDPDEAGTYRPAVG